MNILRFLTPKSAVCYLYHDFTLRQALEKMFFHRHHAVPVIDRKGRYVGSVSDGDFLRVLYEAESGDLHTLEHRRLKEIVRRDVNPAVKQDASVSDLLGRVKQNAFVPVEDDRGSFIGIVTRRDIINYFIDEYERNDDLAK
ncbi:MAG: CBS domain-containing protein [Clostridia bacterium]|jgi:CBS domain-containing protein|nr:CBS domain-containing protein [Clostridia bacterium]